jgi:hypothetical protein
MIYQLVSPVEKGPLSPVGSVDSPVAPSERVADGNGPLTPGEASRSPEGGAFPLTLFDERSAA